MEINSFDSPLSHTSNNFNEKQKKKKSSNNHYESTVHPYTPLYLSLPLRESHSSPLHIHSSHPLHAPSLAYHAARRERGRRRGCARAGYITLSLRVRQYRACALHAHIARVMSSGFITARRRPIKAFGRKKWRAVVFVSAEELEEIELRGNPFGAVGVERIRERENVVEIIG